MLEKETLRSRLKWIMFFRLIIAVILLIAIFLIEPKLELLRLKYSTAYVTLIFVCFLNLVYLMLARFDINLARLATVQILLDILIVSLLVYFTGIDRVFAFLYFATIIATALVVNPAYSFLFASFATVMLSSVSILYFFAGHEDFGFPLPLVERDIIENFKVRLQFLLPYLFSFAICLHIVAFLASRLAHEVSRIKILSEEVLQNIEGAVLVVDRQGRLAFINKQARRLLEIDKEPIGLPHEQILKNKEIKDMIQYTFQTRFKSSREITIHQTDYQAVTSSIVVKSNELRGVILLLNDLTLRKQLEYMSKIEDRFNALLELSSSMAHELRNPLASIKGASQELKAGSKSDPRLLNLLVREVDRLDRILSNFLDYATHKPLDKRPVKLHALFNEIVELLKSRSGDKRVDITLNCDENLIYLADEDKLSQVFLNIGINSLEAVNESGSIQISVAPDTSSSILIKFHDTGRGISRQDIKKIFDPFFSTKPGGTGMGLAIAKKLIQAHNGSIAVESNPGEGTAVKVWLPR